MFRIAILKTVGRILLFGTVAIAAVLAANVLGVILAKGSVPFKIPHSQGATVIWAASVDVSVADVIFPVVALVGAFATVGYAFDLVQDAVISRTRGALKTFVVVGSYTCAAVFAGTLFAAFYYLVITTYGWLRAPSFVRMNLTVSACLVGLPLLLTLSSKIRRRQSWKTLADPWLKWSGVSGIAVGGFGFVGLGLEEEHTSLLKLAITRSQVPPSNLITIYILVVLIWGLASFAFLLGRAAAESEDTQVPAHFFVPAFGFAWLGNFGAYTLFIDGVLLTLSGHLVAAG